MKKTQHTRLYKKLLDELRRARLNAGLTQLETAKKLDKHPPFISKIESGERRVDVIELSELCRLYNISLSKFLKSIELD